MHRDSLDPKPRDDSLESVLENQWHIQRRRKMYMMLVIWCVDIFGGNGPFEGNGAADQRQGH